MHASDTLPVIDGHNDSLLRLWDNGQEANAFLEGRSDGHLDLPRAHEGGFAGGFFAVFVPAKRRRPPAAAAEGDSTAAAIGTGQPTAALTRPVDPRIALEKSLEMVELLERIVEQSSGAVGLVRDTSALRSCLARGTLAAILHFEGAEAIATDLGNLEALYSRGLRSLGLVWSRANAFGHGVPFRFRSTPDTGPGLTPEGVHLVKACNRLGILVDLAHANEKTFWDVAAVTDRPLVVTHAAAHALTPAARNLTDRQLDAIARTGGLVGINFHVADTRSDGRWQAETTLDPLLDHIDYVRRRLGDDHVAFGSDFDGALMPNELGDVTGLPRLLEKLAHRGYDRSALTKLSHTNWLRILEATWH